MIEAIACAKVNFSLHVGPVAENGLHRVGGLFQSVSWVDRIKLDTAEEDSIGSSGGGPVIAGFDNLAWRAVALVRELSGEEQPVALTLDKSIPAAAGLGGGSADAAAALAGAGRLFGLGDLAALAPELGSDVPFCFRGGAAEVGGTGEDLTGRDVPRGFALGLVVPPVEVATAAVFARWDEMGGPQGRAVDAGQLPPSLRDEPLVNDLHPAAAAVAPALEEWRGELQSRWGRPVLVTGSGPTLFAFFVDEDEATEALAEAPAGARGAAAALPVGFGWAARHGSATWASQPLDEPTMELVSGLMRA